MKGNQWEATKTELYAEKYWKEHGYTAVLDSRMLTKSVYRISKDGVEDKYEIPMAVKDVKGFMELFEEWWSTLLKLKAMMDERSAQ